MTYAAILACANRDGHCESIEAHQAHHAATWASDHALPRAAAPSFWELQGR
jgi:hypothetical protein